MNPLKKRYNQRKNKAVAPVLATLLMIAVAVAMSVIIFMWSQGFLAGTADSTGSQQGAQNQAAQSSISIEASTFSTTTNTSIVIVRNVGAVAVQLGNIIATGISSNTGFSGANTIDINNATFTLSKGASVNIDLSAAFFNSGGGLASGDVVTMKVTTDKGTFAQQSYTVP
tara:strand:- start:37 stop:546 length:510 start_codon:yes stop_codon:yes gene_type:complete